MKIEVDLSKLDTEVEVLALQVAATAILRVLPRDAAEDAVHDWCVLTGRDFTYVSSNELLDGRVVAPEGEISPGSEPSEAAASGSPGEISRAPQTAETPEWLKGSATEASPARDEFEFDGRKFSARKRGPRAAVDHAVKLAQGCGSVAELDAHRDALSNLAGILLELGRQDLIDMLNEGVAEARDALAAQVDAHAPDTSAGGSDSSPAEVEAESGAAEVEPDSEAGGPDTVDQDEIPFDVAPPQPDRSATGSGEVQDRAGPPTPRANSDQEPLRDLMRRARPLVGDGRLNDILEAHGASTLRDLDEAGAAAVRTDVLAAINEVSS